MSANAKKKKKVNDNIPSQRQLATCLAKEEHSAELEVGKSKVPVPNTGLPGMNFRLLGFGVSCV